MHMRAQDFALTKILRLEQLIFMHFIVLDAFLFILSGKIISKFENGFQEHGDTS